MPALENGWALSMETREAAEIRVEYNSLAIERAAEKAGTEPAEKSPTLGPTLVQCCDMPRS